MPRALLTAPIPEPVPTERNLSWAEVDWMIEIALAEMLAKKYIPERIIPIGGGGIIPASIMAYRFYKKCHAPVELLAPVYAKSYDLNHEQHPLEVLFPRGIEEVDEPKTLFVDDIVDTGATLYAVSERMPNSSFFALVTKIVGQPNVYSVLDKENQWWNFPWEKVPLQPKEETKA